MLTAKPARSKRARSLQSRAVPGTRTLCIDIGGTGLKALLLGDDGSPATERVRVETPRPATPDAVLRALWTLIEPLGAFERVSCGFPGVVVDGVVKTAPNLHPKWTGFALGKAIADATRRPARVLNDAGVQGYGVVEGHGVEMLLTLGTGMGCALFVDGHYVPNVELAHHPLHKGDTYEDHIGAAALERLGKKKWNRHLQRILDTVQPIFNPRRIYLGGGNTKFVKLKLPANVQITPNVAGLTGGFALWHDADTSTRPVRASTPAIERAKKK